ncbi:hypothetical protein [Prevotella jejuni]|nr:hypothetical protein [Prevotella jejuni]QUB78987.1 hypothetical protein J4857_12185 [Prevotella jejuni]QUB82458.1 hypothetical protein J5A63_09630 [Prevotella jejuni]
MKKLVKITTSTSHAAYHHHLPLNTHHLSLTIHHHLPLNTHHPRQLFIIT